MQLTAAERTAVDAYPSALAAVESRAAGSSVEAVFDRAAKVHDAMLAAGADGSSALERLTADAFAALQRDLRGLIVNREETLIVQPDADFFVALAGNFGTAVDRQFFSAYKSTYPDSVWPVYVEQQTDYSGCTAFGAARLVTSYRIWSDFRRQQPRAYRAAAEQELGRVVHELALSTCACGDRPAVERELQQFLDAFPGASAAPSVASRLRELKEGRSNIRLHCVSG
jgi:hypothetical protein